MGFRDVILSEVSHEGFGRVVTKVIERGLYWNPHLPQSLDPFTRYLGMERVKSRTWFKRVTWGGRIKRH